MTAHLLSQAKPAGKEQNEAARRDVVRRLGLVGTGDARVAPVPQPGAEMSERARFRAFLEALAQPPERISGAQVRTVREIWYHATLLIPSLRVPSVGLDDEGGYFLSWSYTDLPDVSLQVTILRDGTIDWFFYDRPNELALGTKEGSEPSLPREAYSHLRAFRQ